MKRLGMLLAGAFIVFGNSGAGAAESDAGPMSPAVTAHDFTFDGINGETIHLSDFAGRLVLVVNTASQCSFTRQYGPLQALQDAYGDRGLVVIGVPSDDFGGQEPGSEADIAEFTAKEFSVDFPLTAKISVKGQTAHPFYRWAGEQAGSLGKPRWNFHKYLIGPKGELLTWFTSFTEPDSPKLKSAIEQHLLTTPSMAGGDMPADG